MTDHDVTYAKLDADTGERFNTLRRELGVTGFGINLLVMEPGQRGRIHAHEQQEEVYVVLDGQLTLVVEGDDGRVLGPREIVRVGHSVRRQLVNAGDERLVILALGAAGAHISRDGIAWESWDEEGPGRQPKDVPLPPDLPKG
jgi:uncharacterized cupin superfamily protein